jgi:hypothetical protein
MLKPSSGKYISNENFGVVILLEEVQIQCMLFENNCARLEDAADHWIKLSHGEDFDRSVPPIDVVAWATVCLSAMAAIRRLLVPSPTRSKANKRRAALYQLLDQPSLPTISSVAVRNSWEHLDERLDELLPTMRSGSISPIHLTAEPPMPGTVVLKRLDPLTLTVYFSSEGIPLRAARDEVEELSKRLDAAYKKLTSIICHPWA